MKPASTAYNAILFGNAPILRADLLTITMLSGVVYRFTSADINLTVGANTFSKALKFARQGTTQSIGTTPDTIDIEMYDDGSLSFSGANLMTAIAAGLFNGALVQVDKLVMSTWGDTTPGICGWFYGEVSTSKSLSGVATITVKDMLGRLGVAMPQTIIQPSCNRAFGDAGCAFLVSTVTFAGTCTGGTQLQPTASGLTDHQFDLGKITFTSGANAGVRRSVKYNAAGVIYLPYPLPNVPANGDTFNIQQGCQRTQAACSAYGNLPHFKGAPYVPVPETALEGGSGVVGGGQDTGQTGIETSGSSIGAKKGLGTYAQ